MIQGKDISGVRRTLFKPFLISNWTCIIVLEKNNEELLSELILTFSDARTVSPDFSGLGRPRSVINTGRVEILPIGQGSCNERILAAR